MSHRRLFAAALAGALCGIALIAIGRLLPGAGATPQESRGVERRSPPAGFPRLLPDAAATGQPARPRRSRRPFGRRTADLAPAERRPCAQRRAAGLRLHPWGRVRGEGPAAAGARQRLSGPGLRRLPRPQPQPGRLRPRQPAQQPRRRPQPQLPQRMEADRQAGQPATLRPPPLLRARDAARRPHRRATAARGDDLVSPASRGKAARPGLGPEHPGGASLREAGPAPLPAVAMARRNGAELAEPPLPRQRLLCGRVPARLTLIRDEVADRARDRASRPESEQRLRCPAEEVRVGH